MSSQISKNSLLSNLSNQNFNLQNNLEFISSSSYKLKNEINFFNNPPMYPYYNPYIDFHKNHPPINIISNNYNFYTDNILDKNKFFQPMTNFNMNWLNTPQFEQEDYKLFLTNEKNCPYYLSQQNSPINEKWNQNSNSDYSNSKSNILNLMCKSSLFNNKKNKDYNNQNIKFNLFNNIRSYENTPAKNIFINNINDNNPLKKMAKIVKNKILINSDNSSQNKNKNNFSEKKENNNPLNSEVISHIPVIENKEPQNNKFKILIFSNSSHKSKKLKKKLKIFQKIKKNYLYTHKQRNSKYKILDEETKKNIIRDAKVMRTSEVSEKYGISSRNINRWKKIGILRKKGSGRKFKDPSLESRMMIWYNFQDKEKITAKQFKEKALELSNNESFRASTGWLTNIKKKYKIKFCTNKH